MMNQLELQQRDQIIEAAWAQHKLVLKQAFFDGVVALLTILLGLFSFIHAVVRMSYGLIGMLVWAIGLWNVFLQWLIDICAEHSSTPHKQEANLNE